MQENHTNELLEFGFKYVAKFTEKSKIQSIIDNIIDTRTLIEEYTKTHHQRHLLSSLRNIEDIYSELYLGEFAGAMYYIHKNWIEDDSVQYRNYMESHISEVSNRFKSAIESIEYIDQADKDKISTIFQEVCLGPLSTAADPSAVLLGKPIMFSVGLAGIAETMKPRSSEGLVAIFSERFQYVAGVPYNPDDFTQWKTLLLWGQEDISSLLRRIDFNASEIINGIKQICGSTMAFFGTYGFVAKTIAGQVSPAMTFIFPVIIGLLIAMCQLDKAIMVLKDLKSLASFKEKKHLSKLESH